MCVNLPSRDLNSSPYPPTPHKYLYLWSDYCAEGACLFQFQYILEHLLGEIMEHLLGEIIPLEVSN